MLWKPRSLWGRTAITEPTVEECLQRAEEAVARIPSVFWRVVTYTRLAKIWARLHNMGNARFHLQHAIEAYLSQPPEEREVRQIFAIAETAKLFEDASRCSQILTLAFETIEADPENFLDIKLCVEAFLEWNLLEESLRATRLLSDEWAKDKAELLCEVAEVRFRHGETDQAQALLHEATMYLNQAPYGGDSIRGALARAWASGGHWEHAYIWVATIETPDDRAEAWCALAQVHHQQENSAGVEQALATARTHALEVESVWRRAATLAKVACNYATLGLPDPAEALFQESIALCDAEPDPEARDMALDRIAESAIEARMPLLSYQACLKTLDPVYRTFNIIDVLFCLTPTYDASMYADALRSARRIRSASGRAEAYAKIGCQLAWMGQFQQAWRIVRSVRHPYWRGIGLLGFARACAHHQQWIQALRALNLIRNPVFVANAYLNFAEELLGEGV